MAPIKENPLFSNMIQVNGDEDAELDYLEGLVNAQELKILEFEEGMKKSLEVFEHSTMMHMGQKMEEITEKMEKRLEDFGARMDDKFNLLLQILGIDKTINELVAEEIPEVPVETIGEVVAKEISLVPMERNKELWESQNLNLDEGQDFFSTYFSIEKIEQDVFEISPLTDFYPDLEGAKSVMFVIVGM